MSTKKELFTGTLKSKAELKGLNYVGSYIEAVYRLADSSGKITEMQHLADNNTYPYFTSNEGIQMHRDMFKEIVKDLEEPQDVPSYISAKGKLKDTNALIDLKISALTINRLIANKDADGFIAFRDTANSKAAIIGDGWVVPYDVFEHTEYILANPTKIVRNLSETPGAKNTAEVTESIKEDSSLATEHLNTYCAPFRMSSTLFNKVAKFRNRTHYVKLQLDNPDLSFRYHYVFQDRPHLEGMWIIKSHGYKQEVIVTEDFVKLHLNNVIGVTEVAGKRVVKTNGYTKVITNWVTKEVNTILEK